MQCLESYNFFPDVYMQDADFLICQFDDVASLAVQEANCKLKSYKRIPSSMPGNFLMFRLHYTN